MPTFYTIKQLLAGKSFNVRMRKGLTNTFLETDPLNRRRVYRRNVTHVKFTGNQ